MNIKLLKPIETFVDDPATSSLRTIAMEEECKKGRLQAVTAQRDKGSARRHEQSTIKFMHL